MIATDLLLGALFVIIAIFINLIVMVKSFKSYRENPLTQTLLFGTTTLFIALAMSFLIVEKMFLSQDLLNDAVLGMLFGGIAIVLSGCAIVSIDSFSFNMVFPKKYKLLTLFAGLYMVLYLTFWISDPSRTVLNEEIVFPNSITPWIGNFVVIPLLIIPILVFFYYAIKIRNESPISSKRAWILGLGVLIFMIGYTIEIIGIENEIITTTGRGLFIIASLLLYWGLFRIRAKT
ncbi:MAG: hypothetical protein ACTSRS_06330 [Candidatus Helarchaeota archaeon]